MSDAFEVRYRSEATAIERDFLDGLTRIVAGRPNDLALIELAKTGPIMPSQTNVALEAGHSRTLISGTGCMLPWVTAEIKRAREWRRRSRRLYDPTAEGGEIDELKRLRREKARATAERDDMRRQRDAAYTSDASARMLAVALREAGRKADADVRRLRRLAELTVISERPLSAS